MVAHITMTGGGGANSSTWQHPKPRLCDATICLAHSRAVKMVSICVRF